MCAMKGHETGKKSSFFASPAMVAGIVAIATVWGAHTVCAATVLISQSRTGTPANEHSYPTSISADGRYVAYASRASNLVSGDVNGVGDIFLRNRMTKRTILVSQSSAGAWGNDISYNPTISASGRYVVFESRATNLVGDDTNGAADIFIRDRLRKRTTLVSRSSTGVQGDGDCFHPAVSADGRYVAFWSYASNLVDGDTNNKPDVFVHDRVTKSTTLVSMSSAGAWGDDDSYNPSISSDGRYVAFESRATNLVDGDTNGVMDVFVHDRVTKSTKLVSMSSAGALGDGDSRSSSISPGGRYVAFASNATNLVGDDTNGVVDVFVHDRVTKKTTLVSKSSTGDQGDGDCFDPVISADGRYVAFSSYATNLVVGDTNGKQDVFVHDRVAETTKLVSKSSAGALANDDCAFVVISANGRYVSFTTAASNLVSGDTNGFEDVFVVGPLK